MKDLEIERTEAAIVQEIFEKTAYEGQSSYTLATMLNNRGLRTHSGANFTSNHILRIVRHEGYTGYIITRSVRSQYIPELKIIEPELFQKANRMVDQRCTANAEARKVAQKADNKTLLSGIVYCAHCGARMSGFMHKDRYKLRDGTVVEELKPKYNCFQRAQHLRECDGQALYLADRVDAIVLEIAREMFNTIQCSPRDKVLEQKIRQESRDKQQQKRILEKKLQECEHQLERYESEVIKCLDGKSSFSEEMLARLIAKAENELKLARQEYTVALVAVEDEREAEQKIKACYRQFCGWAEEFEMASLARKRLILSQLFEKVEVGKGYEVTVHVNMSYTQFINMGEPDDKNKPIRSMAAGEVA